MWQKFNAIGYNEYTHDNANNIESAVNRYVHSLNVNEYLCIAGRQNACYLMDGQIVKYACGVYGAFMKIAFIIINEMISQGNSVCYRS